MLSLFVFDWSLKWILVISGVLLLAFLLAWLSRTPEERVSYPYERALSLLTVSEQDFFFALQQAIATRYFIACKPRLADVVNVTEDANERRAAIDRIQVEHVDFLLCNPETFAPMLAIELGTSDPDRPDHVQRKDFLNHTLKAAGIPLLAVPVADSYDSEQLRRQIKELTADGQ